MIQNKEIKVYGTLVNSTVDPAISNNSHNDAIVYAKQVYDDRFQESTATDNYQDEINKRVKAIKYQDGTTIVSGDLDVTGDVNGIDIEQLAADIADLKLRVAAIEALWKVTEDGNGLEPVSQKYVNGHKFYDTSIAA